jgi:hypothetical protein
MNQPSKLEDGEFFSSLLEGMVLEAIRHAVPDKDRVADGMAIPDVTSGEQVPSRHPGGPHDQSARTLVSRHVERIVVHATEVEIILRTRDAAAPSVGADGAGRVLRVPLELRPRDRKEIIIPGDGENPLCGLGTAREGDSGQVFPPHLARGEFDIRQMRKLLVAMRHFLRLAESVDEVQDKSCKAAAPIAAAGLKLQGSCGHGPP